MCFWFSFRLIFTIMIDKNYENSPKSDSSKLLRDKETEIPNFTLLYRNAPNPERNKSSGMSSDEETTSSSLVPIPDTLKQMRNKSRWTLSEDKEHSELDIDYACGTLAKSTENIVCSLEELRKKYTLKNETSVALKMNSANLMLDDILKTTSTKKTSNDNVQSKFFKEQEFLKSNFQSKNVLESDSFTTENSVSHAQPCPHVLDHSHIPVALDFFSSPCHRHCSDVQSSHSSPSILEKEAYTSTRSLAESKRKKSLMEKLQDLRVRSRIMSVYKALQKTKNPFAKNKDFENVNVQQGIPGAAYQRNTVNESEILMCKCMHCKCSSEECPKKMILDLIVPSEMSQSESKSTKGENQQCTCVKQKEESQCTCTNQREEYQCTCIRQRECDCPEVIPKCACIEHVSGASEHPSKRMKQNSHSECPSRANEYVQATQLDFPAQNKKEDESSLLLEKEKEDSKKLKTNLQPNFKGWNKYCSKEKNLTERIDIYYFDHGNSAYYQTTDNHQMRYTECLVERTDEYATKFWAEIFGTIEIGVAFFISFFLQFYRFLFTSIIRSLSVGLLQISSDYFFKPLLTILFNGIIQPCLILAYNMATSLRDLCLPISQTFGFFAKEVTNILKSCRIVEINRDKQSSCYCGNKV